MVDHRTTSRRLVGFAFVLRYAMPMRSIHRLMHPRSPSATSPHAHLFLPTSIHHSLCYDDRNLVLFFPCLTLEAFFSLFFVLVFTTPPYPFSHHLNHRPTLLTRASWSSSFLPKTL